MELDAQLALPLSARVAPAIIIAKIVEKGNASHATIIATDAK
jgi:hypothetical protein